MIINAGIRKVYYMEGYADPISEQLLEEAAVDIIKLG
jgi:deoxycytidylate deaminase